MICSGHGEAPAFEGSSSVFRFDFSVPQLEMKISKRFL